MEIGQIIAIAAALLTLIPACVAVYVYRRNSALDRAKWMLNLYEKFYEQPRLKDVREILDSESGDKEVDSLVMKCPADFTDYLNFFEFVAYLEKQKQLTREEIKALFDYYIKCLKRHTRVINFIRENGYEDMQELLDSWK